MPLHVRDSSPHVSLNQKLLFAAHDIVRFAAIFDTCPHSDAVSLSKQLIRVCFNLLPLGSLLRGALVVRQLFDDNQRHTD
jgi:hypothetical protein